MRENNAGLCALQPGLAEETFQGEKRNCGEPIISRWSNWHDGIYPAYGNEELKTSEEGFEIQCRRKKADKD